MSMTQHGIDATIGADGVLDLKTAHPLRVRLNGRMLNGVTGAGELSAGQARSTATKFWQPDGTQGDHTTDLRGEER